MVFPLNATIAFINVAVMVAGVICSIGTRILLLFRTVRATPYYSGVNFVKFSAHKRVVVANMCAIDVLII